MDKILLYIEKGVVEMYAYMTSRVHNYSELIEYSKRCNKTKPIDVSIIEEVYLDDNELALFVNDFKKNQKWLIPYLSRMSIIVSGRWQCLLLVSPKLERPIVVYANMCLYPQYVGILQ